MTENRKTPKLRFKGFTDAWEQRKLGDVAVFNPKEELPDVFEYVDLESVVGNEMLFHRTEEKLTAPSRAQRLANNGDLFYQTVRPYQKNNYLFEKSDKHYVFSTGYTQLRPFVDGYFLLSLVQNGQFVKSVLDKCTGTSYPAINANDLAKIEVFFPKDECEHHQIGTYFRNLDNLITLHQRKLERLKNVKKSMLDKMFPKDGEVVPEIRFKGFTDAWEQRKLGDLAEIRRGLTYKPGDVKASGIRVLRSSNINEEYFEIYEDDVFVDEVAINIPYVKKGDIIITSANGSSRLVGKHAIIKNIQDNSMVHGGFMLVASADEPEFLNSSMSSPWYTKFINIYVAGGNGAIGNLSKNDLDNQEILVPSIAEQQKIGTYFRTIDNLITLHQRKLDKLKNIKKSMLDNMFV